MRSPHPPQERIPQSIDRLPAARTRAGDGSRAGAKSRRKLSIVVPVKDEQATVAPLYWRIAKAAQSTGNPFEILFVDDGSEDGSWEAIRALARSSQSYVRGIRMRRNVGKARALDVGFRRSNGDVVFTLDGDLQDDPEDLPRLLKRLDEGFDIVSGWKKKRRDPWHKVLPSRVFNRMASGVFGIRLHDYNCGFKCYRKAVVEELPLYGEMHRLIPAMASMHGFRTAEIVVQHHPREHGRSKYGVARFWRGLMDLLAVAYLVRYRERPLHLVGATSAIVFACGLLLFGVLSSGVGAALGSSALIGLTAGAVLCAVSVLLLHVGLLGVHFVHATARRTWVAPVAEDTAAHLSVREREVGVASHGARVA